MTPPRRPSVLETLARHGARFLGASLLGWLMLTLVGFKGKPQPFHGPLALFDGWFRWDTHWYLGIVRDGYTFSTEQQSSVAFFPLFPLLVKGLTGFGLSVEWAGVVAVVLTGAAAALALHAWFWRMQPAETASLAEWLFWFSPFALFVIGCVYSDAIFVALVAGAFLALERRQVAAAVVLGFLACAARPVGLAVVFGLMVREVEVRRARHESPLWALALGLTGFGTVAYMVYLQHTFGDALAFVHAQAAWGQLTGIESLLKYQSLMRLHWWDWSLPLFDLALTIVLLSRLGWVRRQLGLGYAVYTALILGIPLITAHEFVGLGRYSLPAFPAFLGWAAAFQGPAAKALKPWRIVSTLLLMVFISVFAIGRFVA